jgi:phenylalanine ammonia-lyase
MMPLIAFFGQSIVDRFPTHAEQFNQNINSQAMNSANLARETLDVLEHYLALALLVRRARPVELRAQLVEGSYDARDLLSPATASALRGCAHGGGGSADATRPIHWNDLDDSCSPRSRACSATFPAAARRSKRWRRPARRCGNSSPRRFQARPEWSRFIRVTTSSSSRGLK